MKLEEIDKLIISEIVNILWRYNCIFKPEDITWFRREFNNIQCPEDKYEIVAVEIDEAISRLEANYMDKIMEETVN